MCPFYLLKHKYSTVNENKLNKTEYNNILHYDNRYPCKWEGLLVEFKMTVNLSTNLVY